MEHHITFKQTVGYLGASALFVHGIQRSKNRYQKKHGYKPGAQYKWSQDYDPKVARARRNKRAVRK